jgi:hypothetical protein
VLVAISGVVQDPSTYSIVGTTLTFSQAPPSATANISTRYLGIPSTGVTSTAYRTVTEFTATAAQTTFTPPSFTPGFVNVYRNGVLLGSADYVASSGTAVVLNAAATLGDLVTVESFLVSSILNVTSSVNQVLTTPTITGPIFNGNINIGSTSSAGRKLQVTSSDITDGIRLFSTDTSGEGLSLEWMSGYGPNRITADIESDASGAGGNLTIRVADTSATLQNRLHINNTGYVGINTGTTVQANLEVQASGTGPALWVQTGGTTSASTIVDFRTGTNAPAFQVFGNGIITTPKQPAFCVWGDVFGGTYGTTFYGNNVTTNVGSNFNVSNGVFTAPISGTYLLSFSLTTQDTNSHFIEIAVNNSNVCNRQLSYGYIFLSATQFVIVNMSAGDSAIARRRDTGYSVYNAVFAGYLLG